jgi:alkylation response protein AidB-like acyl-CoA dehydrogenase
MDFSFTEAQTAVSGLAKKIFAERVTAASLRAAEADGTMFDRKLWADLAAAGLLATAIPEAEGGGGHGMRELCALLVEAGAAIAPIPLWPVLALGALPITLHGSAAQKQRWLPGVAAGDTLLTGALAEENALDATAPETLAARVGEGWSIRGTTICVPLADVAARVVTPARDAEGLVGLFLIDPRAKGVSLERNVATTGEPQFRMTLTDVQVDPADVLVAPAPDGRAALAAIVDCATLGLCALELGVAERALRITAAYVSSRKQFDRPIATFQAVSQRAGDAYIDVESIRLTTWRAAYLIDAGVAARVVTDAVATAKIWAAEAGHRVVYAAQHLHGGIGFDRDYPLYRYYLWSKQIELTLGSASVHLARLGASLAGAVAPSQEAT